MSNKVVFAHLRMSNMFGTLSHFGGITVAMQEDDGKTRLGIAVCHENDRYVKAAGRVRAAGRLQSTAPKYKRYRATVNATVPQVFNVLNGVNTMDAALAMELEHIFRTAGAQL